MIHFFNRAILLQDQSAETIERIRTSLKGAGIPFTVKTSKTGATGAANPAVRVGMSGRTGNMGGNVYLSGGVPHSWMEGNTTNASSAVYIVYVLKKDLERAKEICAI